MDPNDRRCASDGWLSARRPVIVAVALAMVLSVTAGYAAADGASPTRDADTYAVDRGGECIEVTPLTGEDPVKAFYDYRTPFPENPYTNTTGWSYSSEGTTALQRPNTSQLFLYEDPAGNLSLVFVHGAMEDTSAGGSASFNITGLPANGSWAVKDDEYEGASNYDNWTHENGYARIDWTWGAGRTDGGAYAGLGDDFRITIDPAFNEDAALYGEQYNGTVERWELLSGNRTDPRRIPLSRSDPVVVSTGGCDDPASGTATPDGSGETGTGTDATTDRPIEQEQEVTVEQEQRSGTDDRAVEQEQDVEIERENATRTTADHDAETDAGSDDSEDESHESDGPPGARSGEGPPEDSPGNGPPGDVPRGNGPPAGDPPGNGPPWR